MRFRIKVISKAVKNFQNYGVTKDGKVYSFKTKKFLKPQTNSSKYHQVRLSNQYGVKCLLVHRLVAAAFIPNPNNLETVDHIDSNKQNNSIQNLQWMTRGDNVRKYFKEKKGGAR